MGALAAMVFYAGYHVRGLLVPQELAAQAKQLQIQCEADKKITKEANDDLQKNLDAVTAKRNAERLHVNICVPLTKPTKHPSGRAKHAGQDAISSDWLFDYAAECETYRDEVITLIDFQNKVWKANGQ